MKPGTAKRETACWSEVETWRGLSSMSSELVYNKQCRPGSDLDRLITAELDINELSGDDGFYVMIKETDRCFRNGDKVVYWYESPKFNRLSDAQLWADWAIERWHQTLRFTASGAEIRLDLDEKGNQQSWSL